MKNCHKFPISTEPRRIIALIVCTLLWTISDALAQVAQSVPPAAAVSGNTFTNPLLDNGPDPWVICWKGFYYYTDTSGRNLTLRKTADIADLRNAEMKAVWVPEPGHAWSY
jgi:hypothetical protein